NRLLGAIRAIADPTPEEMPLLEPAFGAENPLQSRKLLGSEEVVNNNRRIWHRCKRRRIRCLRCRFQMTLINPILKLHGGFRESLAALLYPPGLLVSSPFAGGQFGNS